MKVQIPTVVIRCKADGYYYLIQDEISLHHIAKFTANNPNGVLEIFSLSMMDVSQLDNASVTVEPTIREVYINIRREILRQLRRKLSRKKSKTSQV